MGEISISAIICHYEQHDLLAQCLASLLTQSKWLETVIIVDDRSQNLPDVEINHSGVEVIVLKTKENHGGPAGPRNIGVAHCTSTHLVFVDADDMLLPGSIESLTKTWRSYPEVIAYGDHIEWGGSVAHPYWQKALAENPRDTVHERLLWGGNQLCLSGTGGPTKIFQKERFDPNQQWEDYDLWLRLAKDKTPFRHTGAIHALHLRRKNSRSGSRRSRRNGCLGIENKHLINIPWWHRPTWFWKQRWF